VDILGRLARIHGAADSEREPEAVGWEQFEATTDDEIETLDEALFETAHLIAGLAAADGAVVMGKDNELLGFGGMISGRLLDVERVARALDLEGNEVAEEEVGDVGARHRSAYRLCGALPGAVAIVVSQDGGVRFVSQRGGRVTYWEQE
jgi:DNA integrity scanning protein DisA with diadenylate cyclase activity